MTSIRYDGSVNDRLDKCRRNSGDWRQCICWHTCTCTLCRKNLHVCYGLSNSIYYDPLQPYCVGTCTSSQHRPEINLRAAAWKRRWNDDFLILTKKNLPIVCGSINVARSWAPENHSPGQNVSALAVLIYPYDASASAQAKKSKEGKGQYASLWRHQLSLLGHSKQTKVYLKFDWNL